MRSPFSSDRERGAALLIVLAFTVILLGIVLTYFSRVTGDRAVSDSSLHQAKADAIATTGMETVIGDLRQEIINGSTATTIGSYTTYTPTASTLLPARSGNPSYTGGPANDPIPNLIRRSWYNDTNLNPRSRASQINSTTDFSLNNHNVILPRWNKHYLIPRPAGASAGDTTPINGASGFTAPDWVLVTRAGATAESGIGTGATAINNSTPTNTNYVLGRYAYAVYDEGGLIDVNVAGYPPAATTPAQYGIKGVSAFADLTQIPGINTMSPAAQTAMIDNLVGWRNYAAAQLSGPFPFTFNSTTATNYVNYVLGQTNGFFGVNPINGTLVLSSYTNVPPYTNNNRTNQQFPNRQSLIQFRSLAGIPEDSLQYLATYSREFNAPSWFPTLNASDMGGNNGTGSIYAYKDNAAPSTANLPIINPNFVNVRVINSFTRPDGSTANVGEPLVRRLPLTRLVAVGSTGPNTTAASTMINGLWQPATKTTVQGTNLPSGGTIQRDFGLIWDSANLRWSYVGGSGTAIQSTIKGLDQVAQENPGREPNFFELLKAAILSGSVGFGSGSANTFVTSGPAYYISGTTPGNFLSSDSQIIQIGANIIDQQDTDWNPTFIYLAGNEFAGVENLPYLSKLVFQPVWTTGASAQFRAWLEPSFWMPAQNGTTPGTASVRFIMTSGTVSAAVYAGATSKSADVPVIANATSSATQPWTQLTTTRTFGPDPNSSAYGTGGSPARQLMTGFTTGSGNPSNSAPLGIQPVFNSTPGITSANTTKAVPIITNATFEMQIQTGSTWKTYQRWFSCNSSAAACVGSGSSFWTLINIYDPEFVILDPRAMRFGAWESDAASTAIPADYTRGLLDTLDRGSSLTPNFQGISSLGPQGSNFGGTASQVAQLANNLSTSAAYYADIDGVRRAGDAITSGDTSAMVPVNSLDRSLILARGYQSVAELGQVFRDQPWKTLDFASPNSGDAALMDIFSLHETAIEAGKMSLNTRQTPVLTAILSQAARRLNSPTSTDLLTSGPSGQVAGIVAGLQKITAAQPIVNKAELITRITTKPSDPAYDYSQAVAALGSKEARESVIRAFADASQTRTWNLLIDVIAQSGRYPSNAQTLKNFLVSGEQHYWVHVAIDRFTGQVIDKQIEVVNE